MLFKNSDLDSKPRIFQKPFKQKDLKFAFESDSGKNEICFIRRFFVGVIKILKRNEEKWILESTMIVFFWASVRAV